MSKRILNLGFYFTAIFLFFFPFVYGAQEAQKAQTVPVTVRAQVDQAKIKVGGTLLFTVTVEHIPGVNLQVQEFGDQVSGFRILDFGSKEDKGEEGRLRFIKWYKLQADVSGSYVLPGMEIAYTLSQQEKNTAKVKTSEIFVEVEAPNLKEGEKNKQAGPRPLKPIIESPRNYLPYILASILLLGGLGGAGGYWYWKKKKKIIRAIIQRQPWEIAEEELETIKRQNLVEENPKGFHFAVSTVMRNYVEAMFAINATDLTSEEIKKKIYQVKGIKRDLIVDFLYIIDKTDFIKFTDFQLESAIAHTVWEKSYQFVQKTRPQVAPESQESVI